MNYNLETRQLSKWFGNVKALDSVDIQLRPGKIVGLLGPNGSGKTTLLKLAAGLLRPTQGEILIDGRAPGEDTKKIVSYLPEREFLNPSMTVYEHLDLFQDFFSDFDRNRAEEMLHMLQVNLTSRYRALSKGTKEKVQLVLIMSRQAKLYLLDEPIGGVDPATRDYILHTIVSNYAPEATVLISTHLISDVEKVLDEFLFLKNGQVVLYSTADQIRKNAASP